MQPHEVWLVILAAVAAVGGITGVWLLRWGWIDRPQHAWNVRIDRELQKTVRNKDGSEDYRILEASDRHKATVEVHPIGTAIAHDVQVRVRGARPFNFEGGLRELHMTAMSDPIVFDVVIPAEPDGGVYVEVTWIRIRPHHHAGQRVNLRTRQWEYWRWNWRSLGRHGWRLGRTKGRWVARTSAQCPEIPPPDQ